MWPTTYTHSYSPSSFLPRQLTLNALVCFWVIYNRNQPLHEGLPYPVVAPWAKDNDKELRRASIGFRFNGDFFDRYWTCHFIQYVPGLNVGAPIISRRRSLFRTEKSIWQRKILELQLLQSILSIMLTSSNKILKDIEAELGLKKGMLIFFVLTTEAYSSSEDHWQIYEELLQKAEEDITSSLDTLSKWSTREQDRGQEKPRWTRNDERKYRGSINKLRNSTERQRWDLESCRDRMCKLRETLVTRRDKIRADLEANREQNIRYFTYVTVIFLPLGFASSFYSMNGAPSGDLIISLAEFAAAAFAVTAILVFVVSAKALRLFAIKIATSVAEKGLLQPLRHYSLHTRQNSLLVKRAPSDNEPDQSKKLHQVYSKRDWMVTSWFWPAYILLELPTRAISSAWTAVGTGHFSFAAVWKVVLGIVVLPIYAMSRAVLTSFGNITTILRISSEHIFPRLGAFQSSPAHSKKRKNSSEILTPPQNISTSFALVWFPPGKLLSTAMLPTRRQQQKWFQTDLRPGNPQRRQVMPRISLPATGQSLIISTSSCLPPSHFIHSSL